MLPFFGPKTQKDFAEKLYGKPRKYRLRRNGAAVFVSGRLLAHYRRDALPDGLMPPAAGRVELLGVLLSAAGRFVVYYAVSYPESEDIAGRHEYVHACPSLDAVRDFLGAMHYPDKGEFADAILVRAAKTLAANAQTAPLATEILRQMPDAAPAPEAVETGDDTAGVASAATPPAPAAGEGASQEPSETAPPADRTPS
ncbi:hypothetical protein [Solidesulfovibrio alcoholivorans]|uniref:hypothetical protein n=1 Tax=Solidesulfovibrio alcoholivorans TaxID=81406 RepID=UPI0005C23B4E|nr:hypothetical protein [Solidesulfovibrio alcoholivorans]